MRDGVKRPPASNLTRLMIVSAALVESCWESIDVAKASKLVLRGGVLPIGEGPYLLITASNLGFRVAMWSEIERGLRSAFIDRILEVVHQTLTGPIPEI